MNRTLYILLTFLCELVAFRVSSQTNFLYDQQSAIEGAFAEGGGFIVSSQPLGQSFIPNFNSVGFVRLWLSTGNLSNGVGSSVFVTLLTNSVTGTVLDTTASVPIPDLFNGYVDFIFSNAVPVSPGAVYYFRPLLASGASLAVIGDVNFKYSNGAAFYNGTPTPQDLWFREGIITVPEPSVVLLLEAGAGVLVWRQVRRRVRVALKA